MTDPGRKRNSAFQGAAGVKLRLAGWDMAPPVIMLRRPTGLLSGGSTPIPQPGAWRCAIVGAIHNYPRSVGLMTFRVTV